MKGEEGVRNVEIKKKRMRIGERWSYRCNGWRRGVGDVNPINSRDRRAGLGLVLLSTRGMIAGDKYARGREIGNVCNRFYAAVREVGDDCAGEGGFKGTVA